MKRMVIVIVAALALIYTMRLSGPSMIYGLENSLFRPLSFTTGVPGPILWIGSVVLVALLLRRALDRRRYNTHHREWQAGPQGPASPQGDDAETLLRDLDRTARNLEKRLEALETILLDRTQTPL